MRLTPDLIASSLSYLNPLKEREIDLRGHRIPAIENLAVAGPHDSIDLTDNDIQLLGNFPLSPRVRTLLLARNRISAIQPGVVQALPGLRNLNLAENEVKELGDLDVLGKWRGLVHLCLGGNPVAKREHYRYWVVWRCPSVRFLDYQKVREVEREKARELFGTGEEPTELAMKIMGVKSKTFDSTATSGGKGGGQGGDTSKLSRLKLTDKEKRKLQELIKKANSLEEINRLEKALLEGRLPPGIIVEDGDAMEE
ncbi:leucine-rich repeat-domain-containing protein [Triangularia verruculosa]|uniref:U2 small nuclear ribonucleoprotein A' n=1 Tax=Triangularia verruculosa TaxID=2587418 RepID=A0AAN6XQZ3_9PEZI|nr:leucine-rich repeat-domain-containing protein [Triangularia verruculosa]